MKLLSVITVLLFFCCSCSKKEDDITLTCYKGQYVGEGCWPVIQILEPLNGKFKNSTWGTGTKTFTNAVGVFPLPANYKDGKPFYFTVSKVDSNFTVTSYCIATKYYLGVNTYSDNGCKVAAN